MRFLLFFLGLLGVVLESIEAELKVQALTVPGSTQSPTLPQVGPSKIMSTPQLPIEPDPYALDKSEHTNCTSHAIEVTDYLRSNSIPYSIDSNSNQEGSNQAYSVGVVGVGAPPTLNLCLAEDVAGEHKRCRVMDKKTCLEHSPKTVGQRITDQCVWVARQGFEGQEMCAPMTYGECLTGPLHQHTNSFTNTTDRIEFISDYATMDKKQIFKGYKHINFTYNGHGPTEAGLAKFVVDAVQGSDIATNINLKTTGCISMRHREYVKELLANSLRALVPGNTDRQINILVTGNQFHSFSHSDSIPDAVANLMVTQTSATVRGVYKEKSPAETVFSDHDFYECRSQSKLRNQRFYLKCFSYEAMQKADCHPKTPASTPSIPTAKEECISWQLRLVED